MALTAQDAPRTFAEAQSVLEANLADYERREPQERLAAAVEAAFASGVHLLSEAGTGTGKSFAYLLPAVLSGQRVVISTATKALQDQLNNEDIPFLADHFPVSAFVLKGRTNYLCQGQLDNPELVKHRIPVPALRQAIEEGVKANSNFLGERGDFADLDLDDRSWARLVCPGKSDCPWAGDCFYQVARAKAKEAKVVVVNHALLAIDLYIRQVSDHRANVLGDYDLVVLDESHEFSDYVIGALTTQLSEASLHALDAEASNFAAGLPKDAGQDELAAALKVALGAQTKVWATLHPEKRNERTWRIRKGHVEGNLDLWLDLAEALDAVAQAIKALDLDKIPPAQDLPPGKKSPFEIAQVRRNILKDRAANLTAAFSSAIAGDWDTLVRWVDLENSEKFGERKVLRTAPVSAAPFLKDFLFDRAAEVERLNPRTGEMVTVVIPPATVVATSATAAVNGSFVFQAEELGVETYESLEVGSPFDFAAQSRLYVPGHLPDPARDTANWSEAAIAEMGELVRHSRGRALLLFTSVAEMRKAYEALHAEIPYNALMQGQRPNKVLAEMFRDDEHSVLFATKSFFTGVSFKGSTLSLVVINKIPFPVPSEPMFQARAELIEKAGGSSFNKLSMPMMTLVLKQGVGRLIRSKADTGAMAILDPRIDTKGYGKAIVRSLPPAKRVHSLAEVEAFFA